MSSSAHSVVEHDLHSMNSPATAWLDQTRRVEFLRYLLIALLPLSVFNYRTILLLCALLSAFLLPEIKLSLRAIPELIRRHLPLHFLIATLVLGCCSLLWCIDSSLLLSKLSSTAGLTLVALLLIAATSQLSPGDSNKIYGGFAIGISLGMLFWICFAANTSLLYQLIAGAKESSTAAGKELAVKPLNLYSVLIWLAIPWLSRNVGRVATWSLFVAFALSLLIYDANGARIGVFLGLAIWLTYAVLPWQVSRASFVVGCAIMLLTPPVLVAVLPIERSGKWIPNNPEFPLPLNDSNQQRIMIWDFALRTYQQAPVLGYGFGNARSVPAATEKLGGIYQNLTLHPHNAILQAGMELGTAGLVLIFTLLMSIAWGTRSQWSSAQWRFVLPPVIANGILLYAVSYGIWQSWLLALIAIAAFVATLTQKSLPDSSQAPS